MRGEFFLEALNDIDDKYIMEAREKTMKKRFNFKPIIAIAACAALALAAVPLAKHFAGNPLGTQGTTVTTEAPIGASRKFTVLYAGGSDSGLLGADVEIETDFDGYDEEFTDEEKVGTKKNIVIGGVEYTGTYTNSTRSDYYGDDTDNYFARANGKKVSFSINRSTGMMTKFYFAGDHSVGARLTKDECYAKAIEHLKVYVPDIEEYELTMAHNQGASLGYLFRFFRMVNGIKTSESIDVRVDYSGEVYDHSLYSIGVMKDADISEIKTEDINKAIADKLNVLYQKNDNVSHTVDDVMLSKLANGKYIFEYKFNVSVENNGKTLSDVCELIVEINK